ncbi:MAG: type II toxin-antitoxin system VapC family toxin, partial [Phycisphaerae bacterium]|nr:type II toxin-antitoxin system VapC family toxin [Phycisphaerae bacterium]
MSIFYLDASAWVPRYERESGTDCVNSLWRSGHVLASCHLGLIEVASAIARRHAQNSRPAEITEQTFALLREDYRSFVKIQFGKRIQDAGVRFARKHHLRGADAAHLAVATVLARSSAAPIILASSDVELLAAARAEELAVLSPQVDP